MISLEILSVEILSFKPMSQPLIDWHTKIVDKKVNHLDDVDLF